jgi:2,3-bisphosphoglycerate-independent phosphoglycerate mutase
LREKQGQYEMAEAVLAAYRSGEDDEALEPRVLGDLEGKPIGRLQNGDYVIFYNIRGEREAELCRSLLEKDFSEFPVEKNIRPNFVTMINYDKRLQAKVAFPPEEELSETLSAILSRHGLRQAKISESEKAIHVSYFLNGKVREPFAGEERIVVPTPKDVPYLGQKPEMNAAGVADAVMQKLEDPEIHFLFANFANIDVVGHIENETAIKKAVESGDLQVGRCLQAARQKGF